MPCPWTPFLLPAVCIWAPFMGTRLADTPVRPRLLFPDLVHRPLCCVNAERRLLLILGPRKSRRNTPLPRRYPLLSPPCWWVRGPRPDRNPKQSTKRRLLQDCSLALGLSPNMPVHRPLLNTPLSGGDKPKFTCPYLPLVHLEAPPPFLFTCTTSSPGLRPFLFPLPLCTFS